MTRLDDFLTTASEIVDISGFNACMAVLGLAIVAPILLAMFGPIIARALS